MRCDVVVIGAGPAGSMSAKTAAEKGLDVILLEKRQVIGDPVRCAEGVSKSGLAQLVKPDFRWISAEVKGSRLIGPDGTSFVMAEDRSGNEVGYVLERKIFDRALALDAAIAGAEVLVKTRALGLLMRNDKPYGISAMREGETINIEAPLIIGADGIESKVGRWAGIDTTLKPKDIGICAQFLVQDRTIDQDYSEFFFGNTIAPGGYAWSFPKGGNLANVGLGIQGSRSKPGDAMRLLKEFVASKYPSAKVVEMIAGGDPGCGPIESATANGVMLVGDAARQADPITGGGILNGMNAGVIAGEVAAEAISAGDQSKEGLKAYEDRWRESIGIPIARSLELKEFFVKLTDDDLNRLMHSLKDQDLTNMDLMGMLKVLIKLNPKLLWNLKHLVI